MKKFILVCFLSLFLLENIYSQISTSMNLEMGDALYRGSKWGHGHAGVFIKFWADKDKLNASFCEILGYNGIDVFHSESDVVVYSKPYTYTNIPNELEIFKGELVELFKRGFNYHGAKSVPGITAAQRSKIVYYANDIVTSLPGYNWTDMLDPKNGGFLWMVNKWSGKVSQIDEIRCDGVVEFAYEKSGVALNMYNISKSGYKSWVVPHNNLHGWDTDGYMLCPYIQGNISVDQDFSGEEQDAYHYHGTGMDCYTTNSSIESPVIADIFFTSSTVIPTYSYAWHDEFWTYGTCEGSQEIWNDQTNEFETEYWGCEDDVLTEGYYESTFISNSQGLIITPNFSDNASEEVFVLVEVKLPTDPEWYILKDVNSPDINLVKYRSMKLSTDIGISKSGFSTILWKGETDRRPKDYTLDEMKKCQFRFSVIDNGGNFSQKTVTYLNDLSTSVFGPNSLVQDQVGTYKATISNSSGLTYCFWSLKEKNSAGTWSSNIILPVIGPQITYKSPTNIVESEIQLLVWDLLRGSTIYSTKKVTKNSIQIGKVEDDNVEGAVYETEISGIFPNPFNPTTTINLSLKNKSDVSIELYDILGRMVIQNDYMGMEAGMHSLPLIGKDNYGNVLPSGVYFIVLSANSENNVSVKKYRKITLLK